MNMDDLFAASGGAGIAQPVFRFIRFGAQDQPAEAGAKKGPGDSLAGTGGFAGAVAPEDMRAGKGVFDGPEIAFG